MNVCLATLCITKHVLTLLHPEHSVKTQKQFCFMSVINDPTYTLYIHRYKLCAMTRNILIHKGLTKVIYKQELQDFSQYLCIQYKFIQACS